MTRSRRRRTVLVVVAVLLVAVGVVAWVRRDDVAFLANLAVPGPAYEAAARRTSDPAPTGDALALPRQLPAPAAPGSAPAVVVGDTVPLSGASALADPPGPGPVLVSSLEGRVHAVDLDAATSEVVLDLVRRRLHRRGARSARDRRAGRRLAPLRRLHQPPR